MSYCAFQETDQAGIVTCPLCQKDCTAPAGVRTIRECKPGGKPRLPCVHLGDEVGREECPTCCGTVLIKVFSCAEHGETQGRSRKLAMQSCHACPDYKPPAA